MGVCQRSSAHCHLDIVPLTYTIAVAQPQGPSQPSRFFTHLHHMLMCTCAWPLRSLVRLMALLLVLMSGWPWSALALTLCSTVSTPPRLQLSSSRKQAFGELW